MYYQNRFSVILVKRSFCTVETASTVGTFWDMGTVLSGLNKQDPLDYGSKSSGAVRTGPLILWGLVTEKAVFNLRKRSFWIVEKSPHVLLAHCRGHVGLSDIRNRSSSIVCKSCIGQ
jgi:hypothetical protein